MLRQIIALCAAASAAAFAPGAGVLPKAGVRAATATSPRMAVFPGSFSDSVPFLKQPTNLDGTLVGDVGFDPLGFSNVADIKFLREAEIKHGRVAMLAAAGAIFQDLATDPGYTAMAGGAKMTALHDVMVEKGVMGQLLFWISFAELFGTIALFDTLEGKRAPGDFKFDPMGMGKKDMASMQLKEIKNGRLAMMGIGGMTHGYFITGKGPLELLGNFNN
uniref:Plastid light harvesting protein n=1 Tax=Hemiselmis andersenii TaxID=464988 RepID=A0A7S0XZU9_HEMAN